MRILWMAGAMAGALALAACQTGGYSGGYPAYPDGTYPAYPDGYATYSGRTARNDENFTPPPPPVLPDYDEPADNAQPPVPPPPPTAENDTSSYDPVIRPYTNSSAGIAMNEEETALRSALNQNGVSLMRDGNNLIVDMQSDMLFQADSATLTPLGRRMVMALSRVVKRYPSTYVNVDDFTDTAGQRESNVTISQDRADAVADILAGDGVETRRLTAVGHGEEYLRVPTAEGVSEGRNRRVQITLEPYAG